MGFTLLQLHWGSLLVKQLAKMLKGKPEEAGRKRASSLQEMDLEEISGRRSVVEREPPEQL